ncbi:hypothetical protein [Paenibacillus brevis]|uniref:Colicin import membrane protein n=1 Tax=Paenibacillus brevis TaxID=2841508 RepID=A0ABS6FLC7_9BACL|nr:hypothetical protein [Paenibacillus brevis]MBU5671007.1 hypothetical protein [Paenibacillus brevis]
MSYSLFKSCRIRAVICFVLLSLILSFAGAFPSYAAVSSSWDEALTSIDKLYDSSQSLESSNRATKQQVQLLRKENNERLKSINTRVQLIGKAQLDHLKAEAASIRQKHAPLLAEYTALGKKASEARKNKDSKTALLYDLKRNRIKPEAASARQSIKQKQERYSAAKKQTAAKAKLVKDAIVNVPAIKKQITAENQQVTALNKRKTEVNKRYKAAIKQGDAHAAKAELAVIVDILKQIQTSQQKIMKYEQSIAALLNSAEARLPN